MLGMELANRELTEQVVTYCLNELDMLLGWTLHSNTLVRLAPPLLIPETDLSLGIERILSAIKKFA